MTEVGSVYGAALYDLAAKEGLSEKLQLQLSALQASFEEEPGFLKLLASPSLSKSERCHILHSSFSGKVHPYVLNFLKILTEKGHIRHFSHCCQAYSQLFDKDHNILPVTVVTAQPLRREQADRLCEKLQSITGKTIRLTPRVDPACMGGVRLDYDGKRLDDTIAHRLAEIQARLSRTVL